MSALDPCCPEQERSTDAGRHALGLGCRSVRHFPMSIQQAKFLALCNQQLARTRRKVLKTNAHIPHRGRIGAPIGSGAGRGPIRVLIPRRGLSYRHRGWPRYWSWAVDSKISKSESTFSVYYIPFYTPRQPTHSKGLASFQNVSLYPPVNPLIPSP